MRGAPQSHRRGQGPGQRPSRWGQHVPHITDAVLGPEAFMKAVASTEDRRKFDRIVGNTAQSQHPSFQLRTGQQRWRPAQTVQGEEFAGSNDTQTSGSPSAKVQGTSIGNDVPSIPHEAMLGNSSTPRGQTRERSSASVQAMIDDTKTFMDAARAMTANRHQLVTAKTSPPTVRPWINIDLPRLNKNRVPTVDGEDMANVSIPYRSILPGTGNAQTSIRSDAPAQSQDVIPKGGNSIGGESAFENEEWRSIANGNTPFDGKAEKDEATERTAVLNHTTPNDSPGADSAPEISVKERANTEDKQRHSRANSGTGAKTKEKDSTITAGAAEGNPAGNQLLREDRVSEAGMPEKDLDPGEAVSKGHVPVDHFSWLLPAKFQ